MELAEANVERDRATTSDKRKRLRNTMDPPRTILWFSAKLLTGRTKHENCNRDAKGWPSLCILLQALTDLRETGEVKNNADVRSLIEVSRRSERLAI
jgi:hypothetical protein